MSCLDPLPLLCIVLNVLPLCMELCAPVVCVLCLCPVSCVLPLCMELCAQAVYGNVCSSMELCAAPVVCQRSGTPKATAVSLGNLNQYLALSYKYQVYK